MSYKVPINSSTLTLKGVDDRIQSIQALMTSSLSWLNKSFGLSDRIVKMVNDKPYIFPATFESNVKDPIPLMPGDVWGAYCFWIKDGEAKFELKDNFPPRVAMTVYNVSCLFYMDIKKIDNVHTYKETKSKLIEDIFHFFENVHINGQLVPLKFIEDDITEVFKGFTIDQIDNKWKMYPKWACRMDFELTLWGDCYSTNSYTLTGPGHYTADDTSVTVDDTNIYADNE